MTDAFIFIKPGKGETKKLLKLINPALRSREFDAEVTTLMCAKLPFYEGYRLIEIFDHSEYPVQKRYVLVDADSKNVTVMTYQPQAIEKLNKDVPLILSAQNIADYVRFYFDMVIGSYGKFQIVEMIDDIPWIEDPSPQERRAIAGHVKDVALYKEDGRSGYFLKASMLFKTALFEVDLKVSKNGDVEILSQDVVKEDLQIKDQMVG